MFTDIPTADIKQMCQNDIIAAKKRMAYEITKLVHGAEEADKAVAASQALFAGGANSDDVPTAEFDKAKVVAGISIVDFVTEVGFLPSKGEARRLIAGNGLSMDGEKVSDAAMTVPTDKDSILLQKGKKNFLKVILK